MRRRSIFVESMRSLVWSFGGTKLGYQVLSSLSKELQLIETQRAEDAVRSHCANSIMRGPFSGMRYPLFNHRGYLNLVSKYLGTFEMELHRPIEALLNLHQYSNVLNIGTADGLYLVGLALRTKAATCIGWEMEVYMQRVTTMLAKENGVADRVQVKGLCTPSSLKELTLTGRTLIFCDCEGAEDLLLTPDNLSGLECYDIIVECHDMFAPNVTSKLRKRFESTHNIETIQAKWRTLSDLDSAQMALLPGGDVQRYHAIEELRSYDMDWLVIQAKG
jgi:hypothetical protein